MELYPVYDKSNNGITIGIDDPDELFEWNLAPTERIANIIKMDVEEFVDKMVEQYNAYKFVRILKRKKVSKIKNFKEVYIEVYFKTREDAQRAIEDFIEPKVVMSILVI